MSQEAERVYTINLGKAWLSPNNQRAKRAINMIREFSKHHMKTEQVKIDQELSEAVWTRGIRSPPRKIRVRMSKTDDGYVLVSPYEDGVAPKAEETKKDKKSKADSKQKGEKSKKLKEPAKETADDTVETKPEAKDLEIKAEAEMKTRDEVPETKAKPKAEEAPTVKPDQTKESAAETKSDEKKPAKKSK